MLGARDWGKTRSGNSEFKIQNSGFWILIFVVACHLALVTALHATTATKDPTSDDAVSGTWTGSAGTRYTLVDDYPDSGGADFLTHGTATAGNYTALYTGNFAIPAGSTGISVQVLYYDRKNSSSSCNIGGRLKVGGSYFNASTHNPANGTWTTRSDNWATNPKTSTAWTVNDINGVGTNALQGMGYVSTDANPAIDLASLRVQVTYTPPIIGSGAITDTSDTSSGSSTSKWILAGAATEGADGSAAGATSAWILTGAGTDSADSPAATGEVQSSGISGSGAPTESADAGSAGSTAEHILTASTAENAESAGGSATSQHVLTAGAIEAGDALSASAVNQWVLTAAIAENAETAAGSASAAHILSGASVDSADSSAASAVSQWVLTASTMESGETAAGSATSRHVLSASPAESADALAGSGSLEGGPIGGNGALVETADASTAGSTAQHILSAAAAEGADPVSASAVSQWVLVASTVEGAESAEAQGAIAWAGSASPAESADAASGFVTLGLIASAALAEPHDAFAASGTVAGAGADILPAKRHQGVLPRRMGDRRVGGRPRSGELPGRPRP